MILICQYQALEAFGPSILIFVLTAFPLGSFHLSVAEGPPVTVVWEMLPSLLLHIGITMPLCFIGGVLLFLYPSWDLISHHVGGCVFITFLFLFGCVTIT